MLLRDAADPLEAVVSRISQQVTEIEADFQAFKTQTANDIQTSKTKTDNDINALKTQTTGDIQTLQNSNTQQDLAIQDTQSSTFVHWGSSTCSNLSGIVYSGVVGGAWYRHSGSATNYLCMTMSPVASSHPVTGVVAYLYGSEYETWDSYQFRVPVCAVCRSTLSTTVMIPGTNVCTPGWHLQYSGFIMTGTYFHDAGSEYICVDSKLENTTLGDASQEGAVLEYTVTRCGTLPCTVYSNNTVVTCAVCSK
ncbi:uncharacterized protein [Littorina saxatilis]